MIFLGPNCPIGNGPVLCAIECQADYMCKLIDRYQTHNIRTFAPTRAAIDDFVAHKDEYMKRTVWSDPCRSWYKAGTQNPETITALWPGSTLHYMEAMAQLRIEDYEVMYEGNRFAWLGNGYSQCELDPTADWGYYIREQDDGEPLSLGARRRILTGHGTVTDNVGISFTGTGSSTSGSAESQAKL
ncbi:hypothetical protein LTS18_010573 [Coniosporium uncinatum]|uniref:Uncharacterized protein n=1 Tax=Coniosporium uncinatum TaxID=93489 RepID=A0ACC3CZA6_9PEZI|nr:hypothetical protein LTS18_010573 [Coniosporium uncinatum]